MWAAAPELQLARMTETRRQPATPISETNEEAYAPWHRLYFFPLPQGHFSLRPIFRPACRLMAFFSPHSLQVQARGC